MNNWAKSEDPLGDLKEDIEKLHKSQPVRETIIVPRRLYDRLVSDDLYRQSVTGIPPRCLMSLVPPEIQKQLTDILDDDIVKEL